MNLRNNAVKQLLLILSNWKLYKYWKNRKKGNKSKDYDRGSGYYEGIKIPFYNPIGKLRKFPMKSGKTGLYEFIDYETFEDPFDMLKHGYYCFVGYQGEKSIIECNFQEFLNIYKKAYGN